MHYEMITRSLVTIWIHITFLKILLIFRDREKERDSNMDVQKIHWLVVFCMPPTGDLAHNPGMWPDWESNQWPFASQAGTQSTEPHQPGPICSFWNLSLIVSFIYWILYACFVSWNKSEFLPVKCLLLCYYLVNKMFLQIFFTFKIFHELFNRVWCCCPCREHSLPELESTYST